MFIQAYVDESGGLGQSSVFVFSALLASAEDWADFSDEWQAILDEPPKINYFKFYEAAQLKGQFGRFSISQRDDKIRKLLIPMRGLLEVFCIADMAGFSETFRKYNHAPFNNPYFKQFHILIMAISLTLIDLGLKEPFEIFFDEHRIFGPRAKAWYPVIREICDEDMRALMPVEPHFESDKEYLPLQAADLLAGVRRAWNDNSLDDLDWLKTELEENSGILLSAHSQYLDRERMERIVDLSFSPEYVERGIRLAKEYGHKLGPEWKPKRMRKDSPEFQRFNEAMKNLVKVPHDELKRREEEWKREHPQTGKKRGRKPRIKK